MYDVGAGSLHGRIWMKSTDGNWYETTISGTSGSAAISINQTPLNYQDNSLGYQLLQGTDGNSYQVTLTGSAGSVNMFISQNPWFNKYDCKPYFFLQSTSDSKFYTVGANVSASVVTLKVSTTGIAYNPGW